MTTADEVAGLIAELRQGHILVLPALPILSTHIDPLHPAAIARAHPATVAPGDLAAQLVAVVVESRQVMVVSQTCDLQAHGTLRGRVLAMVAPIVQLSGTPLINAKRDTRANYVMAPWLGDSMFADLDQMASVDRALLARTAVVAEPPESARRALAFRLGRYFSRAALPNDVVDALSVLRRVAEGKHGAVKRVLESILEFRVLSEPAYDQAGPYHLTLLLVVEPEWLPDIEPSELRGRFKDLQATASAMVEIVDKADDRLSGELVALWNRFLDLLKARLNDGLSSRTQGAVAEISPQVVTSLSPSEIEQSDVLDFGYLSLADGQGQEEAEDGA